MNRAQIKRRLDDLAQYVFDEEPVEATYSFNSEPAEDSKFELGPATGETEADSTDGTLQTDRFQVPFRIETHGHPDSKTAEREAERLFNLFVNWLMAHRTLSHPDVPWTDRNLDDGIVQVTVIGSVEGPGSSFPGGGFDHAWVQGLIDVTTALAYEET